MIEVVGVAAGAMPGPHVTHCSVLVRPGEVVAVVGAAGAGKSVILDVLTGHRRASRGVSQILGIDTADHPDQVRRHLTHIPPAGQIDGSLTLRRQVEWWLSLLHLSASAAAIRRALRDAEIPDRYFDDAGSAVPPECRVLSWVALAHLRNTQVLLIDDPVRSTSLPATRHLTRVFRDLAGRGVCLLIMTRDAYFAETVAHHVVVLENGRTHTSRPSMPLRPIGRSPVA